ncbi:MAG: sulfotransferase domain-containing protein, partial [Hoeflea sp.]
VRYEDLLSQPLSAFGAIARLVGAGGDSENLGRAIRHSSFSVLSEQEEKQGFREKPSNAEAFFRVGKAEQWRTELTPDQVRRVISDHREQMTRFGYVPAEYV